MFNLSQVTLTPGRRDGEINARFIASKEELQSFVPGAYDMLFRPDGTPRSTAGTLHLEGKVPNASLRLFPNGKKTLAKIDLEDFELKAREDGKIAGTFEIEDPKIAALPLLGVPCEIEGTSPWVHVTGGNGRVRASSMEKRTRATKTVAKRKYTRKANGDTQAPAMSG
jgi:hypothetical protein